MNGGNDDKGSKFDWKILLLIGVLVASSSFSAVQWQQTEAEVTQLEKVVSKIEGEIETDILRIEQAHSNDIARLDESNRNRRNQIADLEERIARLEERTK